MNDEYGNYQLPINIRLGKVEEIGKHKVNLFIEPNYPPDGLHSGPAGDKWGIKFNVTFLMPEAKFHAPLLSRMCGSSCR